MAVAKDTPKNTLHINVPWKVRLATVSKADDTHLLDVARKNPTTDINLVTLAAVLRTLQRLTELPADDPRRHIVFGWWPWIIAAFTNSAELTKRT